MTKLILQRDFNKTAAEVWQALSQFDQIYRFHPRVSHSPRVGSINSGVGASRVCHFHDGNKITEKVVAWEEGRSLTVEIVEGSMPLSCARAHIEVEPLGPDRTRVLFHMAYDPKYGILGRAMDALMMRSQFQKILGQVLEGLELHLESGATVGPDLRVQAAA
jgi:carbon monoxide dehydrogenase subunit G